MFTHTYKNHQVSLKRSYSGWQLDVRDPNGHHLPMSLQFRTNERGDFVPDVVNWRTNAQRSIDMRLTALDDLFYITGTCEMCGYEGKIGNDGLCDVCAIFP